jgi:hypothetical protein
LASGVTYNKPPKDHPYRRLSENLRAAERGLTQAERFHKDAIRRNDQPAIEFAARMHQLMVGMSAEAMLRKIITNPAGFNSKERSILLKESQLERWLRAVELAFRRHYAVPLHLEIDASTVEKESVGRFEAVNAILEEDLAEVIDGRNKIAHAQWKWLINSRETKVSGSAPEPLNYRAISSRSKAIRAIAALINDLVISEPTFKRDYETRYSEITEAQKGFEGVDYDAYVAALCSRKRRASLRGMS